MPATIADPDVICATCRGRVWQDTPARALCYATYGDHLDVPHYHGAWTHYHHIALPTGTYHDVDPVRVASTTGGELEAGAR